MLYIIFNINACKNSIYFINLKKWGKMILIVIGLMGLGYKGDKTGVYYY